MASTDVIHGYIVQREVKPREEKLYRVGRTAPETFFLAIEGNEDEVGSLPVQFRKRSTADIYKDTEPYALGMRDNEKKYGPVGDKNNEYMWAFMYGKADDRKELVPYEPKSDDVIPASPVLTRIPEEIVLKLGLRNGYRATILVHHDTKMVAFSEVNGFKGDDLYSLEDVGRFIGPGAKIGTHPVVILPLGHFSYSIRCVEALGGPVGLGTGAYWMGPGGSGKTFMGTEAVGAGIEISRRVDGFHTFCFFIGEHSADAMEYQRRFEKANGLSNVEYFAAPETDDEDIQYSIFEYGISRARGVMRYKHAFVVVDNVVRPVDAFETNEDTRLMSGGIYRKAYQEVKKLVGGSGWLGTGSITLIALALYEYGSDLTEFVKKTVHNVPTSFIELRKDSRLGEEHRPHMKVLKDDLETRWSERFSPSELLAETKDVRNRIMLGSKDAGGGDVPPWIQHERAMDHFIENPEPVYSLEEVLEKLKKGETTGIGISEAS